MKKLILASLLSVISLQQAFACDFFFKTEDLCMNVGWISFPKAKQNGSVRLQFFDKRDPARLVNPKLQPNIILWMTSMGHGSKPVTLQPSGDGQFTANDVFFIMAGPWDIKFGLKDGSKIVEEYKQSVTVQK